MLNQLRIPQRMKAIDRQVGTRAQLSRRDFVKSAAVAGTSLVTTGTQGGETSRPQWTFSPANAADLAQRAGAPAKLPDLKPARWLWYPSERCLANTMVLFRRRLELPSKPRRAAGWVIGSSRYLLFVNGRRIQFGPAPCDPRFEEIDPMDLTEVLQAGANAIGVQVLYYGHGDGTSPVGQPGFLFCLDVEDADGSVQRIVSDGHWQAHLARAWRPGQYKRWYLRAFQEEFDARLFPHGWAKVEFEPNRDWLPARQLSGTPDRPSISAGYGDYAQDTGGASQGVELRPRSIPPLREQLIPVKRLAEQYRVEWLRPAEEYFECLPPNSFKAETVKSAQETGAGAWQVELEAVRATALTFEFEEQIVGWPYFTIEAPAGTTIELMVQEAHAPDGPALLNTHFHAWSRFICREGVNRFEAFDFESLRWLQLHIRNAHGAVTVRDVGVRRRAFPWSQEPQVRCSDAAIQRVLDASINTLLNSAQETVVDGMGRERQQYSGDGGHQLHAIYYAFWDMRLPARFVRTWSQGMTLDGYFLDCWPAYDRLARLVQRQLGLSQWGPLLDHGVGFNFDCYYFYLHSGELEPLAEAYPRLLKFAGYLRGLQGRDGLLPVEDVGVPAVWMDHQAYRRQRHKQCAFNLYVAAMLEHALPALARAFGDETNARAAEGFGEELRAATVKRYWDPERELFVNNRPWLAEEKELRLCDRSTATAILFDQCPGGRTAAVVQALAELPQSMGESYPCNANWRYWALAKAGRIDVVLKAVRERWARMASVRLNNTLQEDWEARPDSGSQWSHCAVAPLYCAFMNVAGIQPLAPGFRRCEIRPQPGDLESLELTARTVRGPIHFRSRGQLGDREISIGLPAGCEGELVLPTEEQVALERLASSAPGLSRYRLAPGKMIVLKLRQC
jgi:alpha-L-rhamnosidase